MDIEKLKERLTRIHTRGNYPTAIPCNLPVNPDGPEAVEALTTMQAREATLIDLLRGIKWRSADRDNMEFAGTITYWQMDKIREALGTSGLVP
jgi:hypothetical protein